ncbi:hypothetical protein [Acidisphaera sp. L21]|jgi:hypothetical protein|uniref:hypothetical protein n=1 Tax=Acidisphaera sp. L21 TaxID=1641851 RepID=UPI00131BE49E|nr:hypothetical protein [Acidisphaera sp. L21]
MMTDPAFTLADHVFRTEYADLPPATIAATKSDIATDDLGIRLRGERGHKSPP